MPRRRSRPRRRPASPPASRSPTSWRQRAGHRGRPPSGSSRARRSCSPRRHRPGRRDPPSVRVRGARRGPVLGSFELDAEVRLDAPASVNNRDVIVVFGWQSDTEYYYAHLSQDNTIYAHNGIFKVAGADRERIDDQWDGAIGAPPP
ncbi:hypothetical protein NKG05_22530 [Oerskovia sp. M15]